MNLFRNMAFIYLLHTFRHLQLYYWSSKLFYLIIYL